MPINTSTNQSDEWQVQVSKRKKNVKKQKKGQRYSSKEQMINKRDNAYYYQTSKRNKDQNGNKNKSGKRSNKYENKVRKQNKVRDNILDSIPIERNKNLNIIKSTSLLKIQFERQQNEQKGNSIDAKSKDLLLNPKKTMSEISDITAVSVTSEGSDSNSASSSTLTQTNSLIKDNIEGQHNGEVIVKNSLLKDKLSESTLLNKENDNSSDEKNNSPSTNKLASPETCTLSNKSSSVCKSQSKTQKEEIYNRKDEIIKKLESQCSLSSSSSVTSFESDSSTKTNNSSRGDSESVRTAKNETDNMKISDNKKEAEESKKQAEEKKEENKVDIKKETTKKVLEFNFKNYTDVQPFIPKHLKAKQEQAKVEIIAPKPQNARHYNHTKNIIEKKPLDNDNTPKRKAKEINKIIRIDPSCLHQKDGHIVPIPGIINMKNGKNHGNNSVQEILQRNIQQKTNELQESKKKKFEELRKSLDQNDKGSSHSQGYQSLPIRDNNKCSQEVSVKKYDEKVNEKERPKVRKTMSNSVLEVSSSLTTKREHQRTNSYTMNNIMQRNLVDYKDDYLCHSISQLAVSNRIENEYNNVKCYSDPMEQSLTRVKPASIKRTGSVQSITTSLSRKSSNHQLLLGGGNTMTITNTITTCKTTPRLRSSRSFSWLKGARTGLENTHVTTVNTTTTTSHTSTIYTNLVGSSVYYPIVVLPTATVQELSVETTSRKLKSSTSLPNMMGRLIKKITWPFGGNNIESGTPISIDTK